MSQIAMAFALLTDRGPERSLKPPRLAPHVLGLGPGRIDFRQRVWSPAKLGALPAEQATTLPRAIRDECSSSMCARCLNRCPSDRWRVQSGKNAGPVDEYARSRATRQRWAEVIVQMISLRLPLEPRRSWFVGSLLMARLGIRRVSITRRDDGTFISSVRCPRNHFRFSAPSANLGRECQTTHSVI
jgi:hypothetical protein